MKKTILAVALAATLTGCAVVPPNSGENPADPWETMNRQTHAINMKLDKLILHPLAVNYVEHVPETVRGSVSNFFDNLAEPRNTINNLLQGKFSDGFVSFARFLINSTVGVVGLFDVASHWNINHHPEDFGQTLGRWGVPNGPYVVLPLMGYCTVRETVGLGLNWAVNPMSHLDSDYRWATLSAGGIWTVEQRAQLLSTDMMLATALDPYIAIRDAYLQQRLNLVWDGNPPITLPVDEFEDDFEEEDLK